jgi:hypothetical protein
MKQINITYRTLEPLMQFTDSPWPNYLRNEADPRTGHGNESWHNYSVVVHENQPVAVPCVSGNSVRGKLRRFLADDLLTRLGLRPNEIPLKLFHLLYNGGGLEESSKRKEEDKQEAKKASKPAAEVYRFTERELREHIPHLDLLGASYGIRICRGLISVGDVLPLVKETAKEFNVDPSQLISATKLAHWRMFTRKDDAAQLIGIDRQVSEQIEESAQMIYKAQYIPINTEMRQRIRFLVNPTELQEATLHYALQRLAEMPYLGGKSNLNFGLVDINFGQNLSSDAYVSFMENNSERILAFLKEHFNIGE